MFSVRHRAECFACVISFDLCHISARRFYWPPSTERKLSQREVESLVQSLQQVVLSDSKHSLQRQPASEGGGGLGLSP